MEQGTVMQRFAHMPPGRIVRRGSGLALCTGALGFPGSQGARLARSEVRVDDGSSPAFAERYGFSIGRRRSASRLDPATSGGDRPPGAVEEVEATGIEFVSMADLGGSDGARRSVSLRSACSPGPEERTT